MASPPDTAAFIIFSSTENGKPDRICPYDESTVTQLLVSINVCREMLALPEVHQAFQQLAEDFNTANQNQNPWYTESQLKNSAEFFIAKIRAGFPLVFIDNSIKNPNFLGCHFRHGWEQSFQTQQQAIVINGWVSRD